MLAKVILHSTRKQSVLATEVIRSPLLRPTTPPYCINPIFPMTFLAHHRTQDDRTNYLQKTQDSSSSLCLGMLHSGPGFLHFLPSEVSLALQCAGSVCLLTHACSHRSLGTPSYHTEDGVELVLSCHHLVYSKVPKSPVLPLICTQ